MARNLISLLAALSLCASAPAFAQTTFPTPAGSRVNGVVTMTCDGSAANCVPSTGGGAGSDGVAQGSTTAGQNGVLGQCAVTTTAPTYTTAQTSPVSCSTNGEIRVQISQAGTVAQVATAGADGVSTSNMASTASRAGCYSLNATTWDRCRNIIGALAAGTGTLAVAVAPHSAASGGIAAGASTAVESNHVGKASAGNLYRVTLVAGASAGFLMVFNATTAPADGAVTPIVCLPVAANGFVTKDYNEIPSSYATGITFVFSTTGCFSKTASATAFFEWSVM